VTPARLAALATTLILLVASLVAYSLSRPVPEPSPNDLGHGVTVVRDEARHVTCWVVGGSPSLSCLRDPEPCAKPGVVR
jgi:hypothetical protein